MKTKKKTSWIFYLFQGLHIFWMEFFLNYGSIFWFYYHTHLTKVWGVASGLIIFEVFTGLWLSTPTFCIKGYDYVKHFVHVLVLLLINTGCPKSCKKMGNTTLLISSSNYAKTCAQEVICVPRFLAIFLKHPVWRLVSFPAGGRSHFLLSSWTLPLLVGNSLLVIQKAKLLNMNS